MSRRSAVPIWLLLSSLISSPAGESSENSLGMTYLEVRPGDRGVGVLVVARHDEFPLHGFSLAVTYPREALRFLGFSRSSTTVGDSDADFFQQKVDHDSGAAVLGVILPHSTPPVFNELPPTEADGKPHSLSWLLFDVEPDAEPGEYEIRFSDGLLDPPIFNHFSVRGQSVFPRLEAGRVRVRNENVLSVDTGFAFPGSRRAFYAYARHPDPLLGYQVALAWDRRALILRSAGIAGTDAVSLLGGTARIEFLENRVESVHSETESRSIIAVVFDFVEPFDSSQVLPSSVTGKGQTVAVYDFEVSGDADRYGDSFELRLADGEGPTAFRNAFIAEGGTASPELNHGRVYFSVGILEGSVVDYVTGRGIRADVILEPGGHRVRAGSTGAFRFQNVPPGVYCVRAVAEGYFTNLLKDVLVPGRDQLTVLPPIELLPPPELGGADGFRRAFVNPDRLVDVTDAIAILTFLFLGGIELSCQAAADLNDDDQIDISDAIQLLRFQFLGGAPPSAPFVECGEDSTPGELTCERSPVCG